ncbi:MAG TPA: hypothetical protein P5281_05685, partial [Anaerovoracaceae bacterium]|nr:hypothetical protein [Anaerovoracaceae bacterium]
YKLIRYFVEHYNDFRTEIPVSDEISGILSLYGDKPYRTGTYRTDFLIDQNNDIRFIEITCRFALNGFFISGFFDMMLNWFLADKPWINKIDEYTPFYDHLVEYFGDFRHFCLLEGADKHNETKYLIPIIQNAGYQLHIIPADCITDNLRLLKDAAVISELSHAELCRQPLKTVEAILRSNLLNDLRTVFLVHDKRLFSLFNKKSFQANVLTKEEMDILSRAVVPTYTRLERPDLWSEAFERKDAWIIKPCALGKGKDVYAGKLTAEAQWKGIFASDAIRDMTLQPYIEQRKFSGSIGSDRYNDFAVGTLLFFDDHYFGPGLFRASSYPITNRVDDRKIAALVTPDTGNFDMDHIL